MTPLAPIALFAYRRPEHLARTLAALNANPEAAGSILYVFADAARDASVARDVEAVRALIGQISGFAEVRFVPRHENHGLARNITTGVSQVLAEHERVIVVEDDVVVSPYFLRFMNDALALYEREPRVGSVTGYCYPLGRAHVPESFFIKGADCWGWATWRDRWRVFEPDGRKLLAELDGRGLAHAFDFDGAMGYRAMLVDQIEGRNDSWAVRWHASCFLRDLLILYPGRSLVANIGNDGSGTHSTVGTDVFDAGMSRTPVLVGGIPIEENGAARTAIRHFFQPETTVPEARPSPSQIEPMSASRRLRRLIRPWLPPALLDLLRGPRMPEPVAPSPPPEPEPTPQPTPPAVLYRGLNELDRQIEKHLDFDSGFFVELGANDGLFQSNTWHYETHRGWRGVLVEPAPNLFLACRRNRSERTHVACAACVPFGYDQPFVPIAYSNAMSVSLGLESDIADPRAHAELGRQFLHPGETVFTFGALARPLNDILLEADAPRTIDFLSLDVEGAELEVLKGIDHTTFRFRFILVECRDIARLECYLTPLGYALVERFNEHDYLFAPAAAPVE